MLESFHFVLLLLSLLGIIGISWGLGRLLRQGAAAAQLRNAADSALLPGTPARITWHEIQGLTAADRDFPGKLLQELRRVALGSLLSITRARSQLASLAQEDLADPIDGTAFHRGETIARCACGTSYHLHSWKWIGDKNAGKCVNCKRSGLVSSITFPEMGKPA